MNGNYGGTSTLVTEIPVGKKFHVCNGMWDGEITEGYTLDIEIKKE